MVRSRTLGAIHAGLRGPNRLLRGGEREKRVGGGDGDFELRALEGGFRLRLERARDGHVGAAQSEIEGLPADQHADALPQAVPKLLVPSTGPEIEGITLCGSSRPKTLFRVARLTWASASTRGR